jgi:hypothetical protein
MFVRPYLLVPTSVAISVVAIAVSVIAVSVSVSVSVPVGTVSVSIAVTVPVGIAIAGIVCSRGDGSDRRCHTRRCCGAAHGRGATAAAITGVALIRAVAETAIRSGFARTPNGVPICISDCARGRCRTAGKTVRDPVEVQSHFTQR